MLVSDFEHDSCGSGAVLHWDAGGASGAGASHEHHIFAVDNLNRLDSLQTVLQRPYGEFVRLLGSTRTLDSHACRLRHKLSRDGERFVVNVWGIGYRLCDGPVNAR
ncbi:helix-turn-helix domain-containing protein [Conexibacter stalactiti]|uniref:Helix-turn-helix domain-containing protein n=1 Tax=Conexibacter stalactiti TaxID=1940611 RepID=A0ABU4HRF7_9ACTN|nr:helix-turn-helix domain-containing protein [Conexibacter stalactiti]MDW5595913.1 helix-turn-helix domain-containing protein [Conexibacter stalactiti]MEC5036555.1 helix-turn-helix domain-containing protein [Conexibacter stalactiti]